MQAKPSRALYNIVVEFPGGLTRNVKTKAASREKAEKRALKFHPGAIRVKRETD